MGPIHAAALQLVVRGIISIDVSDRTKNGTEKIANDHFIVFLLNSENINGGLIPTYTIVSTFDRLTCTYIQTFDQIRN